MWKNFSAEQATDGNKALAHFITEDMTNTRSECVIIIAVPRKQWLHEGVSMLRLYVLCLSFIFFRASAKLGPGSPHS
jgi:hypothetical protein